MTLFYIQESKEDNRFKCKINNMLNKIEDKENENKIFLTLPIRKDTKPRKIKTIANKIEKYKIKTAILSDELYDVEQLKNELYARNINILDGKYIFKILIEDIINYIYKKSKREIEKTEVSILTNEISHTNQEIIIELAQKIKTLNIITNHIDEFKNLEDYLYNEKGIIIKVSNNYKIALQKTDIILNLDFPEETINKYSIPNKSIIININGEIKIKSKKFNGINTNSYTAKIPNKYKIEGFYDECVYESYIWGKEYDLARKQILDDKIRIKNLIGEKGIINSREFDKL